MRQDAAVRPIHPGVTKVKIGDEELLLSGDIILAVLGVRVGERDWRAKIRAARARLGPSGGITLSVLRSGRRLELRSTLP